MVVTIHSRSQLSLTYAFGTVPGVFNAIKRHQFEKVCEREKLRTCYTVEIDSEHAI